MARGNGKSMTFGPDYAENYLACRAFGHAWAIINQAEGRMDKQPVVRRMLTCARCKADRNDVLDKTYALVERRYTWPEGYLLKNQRAPRIEASREVGRRYFASIR